MSLQIVKHQTFTDLSSDTWYEAADELKLSKIIIVGMFYIKNYEIMIYISQKSLLYIND